MFIFTQVLLVLQDILRFIPVNMSSLLSGRKLWFCVLSSASFSFYCSKQSCTLEEIISGAFVSNFMQNLGT